MGKDEAAAPAGPTNWATTARWPSSRSTRRRPSGPAARRRWSRPAPTATRSFKVLYDKIGMKLPIPVYHITEYLEKCIAEGNAQASQGPGHPGDLPRSLPSGPPGRTVDPLERQGGQAPNVQMWLHDPPKKYRRGSTGSTTLPGTSSRASRAWTSWRCIASGSTRGAAGPEAGSAMPIRTSPSGPAAERLKEAKAVGAEAIVSACPWCKRNFLDAAARPATTSRSWTSSNSCSNPYSLSELKRVGRAKMRLTTEEYQALEEIVGPEIHHRGPRDHGELQPGLGQQACALGSKQVRPAGGGAAVREACEEI